MRMPLLYYIRHGETDWNREARLQGQRDIPINATGRAQARKCGELLKELFARDAIDAGALDYVASPLGRARETMEIARAVLGLDRDYRTDERLAESLVRRMGRASRSPNSRHALPKRSRQRDRDKWTLHAAGRRKLRHDVAAHARLVRFTRARHGRGRARRHAARTDRAARHLFGARKRRISISRRASST